MRVEPTLLGSAGPRVNWTDLDRTDRAMFVVLVAYPLIAPVRAWTLADDFIIVLWGIALLGGLLRGRPFDEGRQWIASLANPTGIIAIGFAAYVLSSLAWSVPTLDYRPIHAFKTVAIFVLATVVAKRLTDIPSERFQYWAAVSIALGFLIFAIDGLIGHQLLQIFYGPSEHQRINPNAVALSLLLWPALAALAGTGRRALAAALWLFAGVVLFFSPSQAAFAGCLVGAAVLIMAWLMPSASVWLVTAAAIVGVAAAPFLPVLAKMSMQVLPDSFLYDASATFRVEIWSRHAEAIGSAPLFGQGALSLGRLHPHNFPLQIWREFGAVGAVGTIAMLVSGGFVFLRMKTPYRPFALACAAAIYLNAYLSYGLWETQFLSMILLAVLMIVHGTRSLHWSTARKAVYDD